MSSCSLVALALAFFWEFCAVGFDFRAVFWQFFADTAIVGIPVCALPALFVLWVVLAGHVFGAWVWLHLVSFWIVAIFFLPACFECLFLRTCPARVIGGFIIHCFSADVVSFPVFNSRVVPALVSVVIPAGLLWIAVRPWVNFCAWVY